MNMRILRYGNTNTCFLNGLLIDTDYAGTIERFYRAIKEYNIRVGDIKYVLATHYHPDHMGLMGELMKQGVRLLVMDTQCGHIHDSDKIFSREKNLRFEPIDESQATVISCAESRDYLMNLGISGQIISTPSHSPDSISLILDNGSCIVGDLEPIEYLAAYDHNTQLKKDWEKIMSFSPKKIIYAHVNEKIME